MVFLSPGVCWRCTELSSILCVHFTFTPLSSFSFFRHWLLFELWNFHPPDFLPLPLLTLLFLCLLPLSLCSLSSFLLCMSTSASPNSNSVCDDFYFPHILSVHFRTHLINQIKGAFVKNKSLSASQQNFLLSTKS